MTKGSKIRAKHRRKAAGFRDINPVPYKNHPRPSIGNTDNSPHDNSVMRLAFINQETGERVEGRPFTPDYKPTDRRTRQRIRRALRAESSVELLKRYGYTGEKSGLFVGYRGLVRRARRKITRTIAGNKFRVEYGQFAPLNFPVDKKITTKLTGPRGGRYRKNEEAVRQYLDSQKAKGVAV